MQISDNQKIFPWLEPEGCWHEPFSDKYDWSISNFDDQCRHCQKYAHELADNPDYAAEGPDFFTLEKGIRAKGWHIKIVIYDDVKVEITNDDKYWTELHKGQSDTLPAALCAAVLQLIESNGGE